MFKLPNDYEDKLKLEYDLKYVILEDGSKKHVSEFTDESITLAEYNEMKMNSYARNEIQSKLSDEALLEEVSQYLNQCVKPNRPSTYEEALVHLILPELIIRYKKLQLSDMSKEESSIHYYNIMKSKERSDE